MMKKYKKNMDFYIWDINSNFIFGLHFTFFFNFNLIYRELFILYRKILLIFIAIFLVNVKLII